MVFLSSVTMQPPLSGVFIGGGHGFTTSSLGLWTLKGLHHIAAVTVQHFLLGKVFIRQKDQTEVGEC